MLHHMPAPDLQDRLFAEVHRMLRPGGRFFGTDAVDHEVIREFHVDDIFVPVDPATLGSRLEAGGFATTDIQASEYEVRFKAVKAPS